MRSGLLTTTELSDCKVYKDYPPDVELSTEKLWIVDDNGKYNLKNSYLPCDSFGCHSDALYYKSEQFKSRITMICLSDGRNPVLILTDDLTGEAIYPGYKGPETNIIALIKAACQNKTYDFDAGYIFDLSLVFDAGMKATVYIDNWEVKVSVYEI